MGLFLIALFLWTFIGYTPVEAEGKGLGTIPLISLPDLVGHWAENTVREMVSEKIFSGYPDGLFHPDAPITRAEFCKAFSAAMGIAPDDGVSSLFDLDHHWAKGPIIALQRLRVIEGYADGTFRPDQPIGRGELSVLLQKAFALLPLDHPADFDDLSADFWALPAVQAVTATGLIVGYPDGTFRPLAPITRAEAAIVLTRACALPSIGSPAIASPASEDIEF